MISNSANMKLNYDAILLVSFGGPEKMEDVRPYLENVLRGKRVPDARKEEVVHHYEMFNGVSPINSQNRSLVDALRTELNRFDIDLPIYWGNRNWHPYLQDTVKEMADSHVKKAIAFVTSAYSSYSGCRQYREDILDAQKAVGPAAPEIDKIRVFYNHPGFIKSNAELLKNALSLIPNPNKASTHVAFTAHSLPLSMAGKCQYEQQLNESCKLVSDIVKLNNWSLVYQSRSGSPRTPWLEPDICDHLKSLKEMDVRDVIIAPIGFLSDHMEVLFDLDTEAKELCEELGINMVRAKTVGLHPEFVSMVRELITERLDPGYEPRFLGTHGVSVDYCNDSCCLKDTE